MRSYIKAYTALKKICTENCGARGYHFLFSSVKQVLDIGFIGDDLRIDIIMKNDYSLFSSPSQNQDFYVPSDDKHKFNKVIK